MCNDECSLTVGGLCAAHEVQSENWTPDVAHKMKEHIIDSKDCYRDNTSAILVPVGNLR
jgi:hypothetical protein